MAVSLPTAISTALNASVWFLTVIAFGFAYFEVHRPVYLVALRSDSRQNYSVSQASLARPRKTKYFFLHVGFSCRNEIFLQFPWASGSMLPESGNYLLKGLRSWFLRCKKIPRQSVGFPADQAQQSWHFMVIVDVVRQEKLFYSFHIGFPVLFCVIKTLYLPSSGHSFLNFTSSPL